MQIHVESFQIINNVAIITPVGLFDFKYNI